MVVGAGGSRGGSALPVLSDVADLAGVSVSTVSRVLTEGRR
ncbi:LacI family DNA-binding transcriptional regulator [Microbacterium sp. E-13]